MKEIISRLTRGLTELFPDLSPAAITPETVMGEIPDWDSMSAINLQVFLNDHFGTAIEQDFLNDDTSIRDIIDRIRETVS